MPLDKITRIYNATSVTLSREPGPCGVRETVSVSKAEMTLAHSLSSPDDQTSGRNGEAAWGREPRRHVIGDRANQR